MDMYERRKVRHFVTSMVNRIQNQRLRFRVLEIDAAANKLRQELKEHKTYDEDAWQYIEDALRYLAFYLADYALHSQAMHVGTLLNTYRTRTRLRLGLVSSYIRKGVLGWFTGYTTKPFRLLFAVGGLLFIFTAAYYLFAFISQSPSIVDRNGMGAPWYFYPYFSLTTFLTMSFGDFTPNTAIGPWGCIPSYLACLECLTGYIMIGVFISLLVITRRTHPYSRIGQWQSEYERKTLGRHVALYHVKWKGYSERPTTADQTRFRRDVNIRKEHSKK